MADITGRDSDGELIATPTEWDEEQSGAAPKIRIHVPRRPQPGTAAGVGDRALLRVEKPDAEGGAYSGRVIKVVDHAKTRVLGIFRKLADGGGRLVPVDKKQAGRELNIAKADTGGAEDGDLVSVDLVRSRGFGLASGKVKERLGSLASEKAVSLIAIHAHEIPQAFSPAALARSRGGKTRDAGGPRGLARRAAGHHRSARRKRSRRRGACRTGSRSQQQGRLYRQRRHRRRRVLCAAGIGAGSRRADARQFGLLPRSRGADAARTHLQRSVFAGAGPAARRAGGAHDHRRRRPQALALLSSHPDALGGEAELRAGAGRDRREAR